MEVFVQSMHLKDSPLTKDWKVAKSRDGSIYLHNVETKEARNIHMCQPGFADMPKSQALRKSLVYICYNKIFFF